MSARLEEPTPYIRRMEEADLASVMRVENSAYTHPWSEGILHDCLRAGYNCWVCERGTDIVGHAVMSTAVGEAHLLNICIDPRYQGLGLGRRLLRRMFRIAARKDTDTMFLEVRSSNLNARRLYESEGFAEVGRRRDYYPGQRGQEDAIVYAKAML